MARISGAAVAGLIGGGVTPIQVTFGELLRRHEDALEEFYRQFPLANEAIFVTLDSFIKLAAMNL